MKATGSAGGRVRTRHTTCNASTGGAGGFYERVNSIATAVSNSNQPKARRTLTADTLAASVIILLTVTVVQRTVGFGRGILFCRWLSPESLESAK